MLTQFLRTTFRNYSVPPVLKVLSLDARDTLISLKESPSLVYSRFANNDGLYIEPDFVLENFIKNYKRMSSISPCFGFNGIGSRCWWKEVVALTLLDCSPKSDIKQVERIANNLYDYYATPDPWKLVEDDVRQTLQRLRLKGIVLVVTSNFDSRLKSLLTLFNLTDLFSMIILSGEIGFEKPEKSIYQLIVNHFELTHSSEILHIGDNYKNDFLGAKNFGCKSLLFDPHCVSSLPSLDRISRLSDLKLY